MEADPGDADALYYWSDVAKDMGLLQESETKLSLCLKIAKAHSGCIFDLMEVRIREGRFDDVKLLREEASKNGVMSPWLEEPSGYAELAIGNTEPAIAHFGNLAVSGQELGSSVLFRASQDGITEIALYRGQVDSARRQLLAALGTSRSSYEQAHYFLYLAEVDSLTGHSMAASEEVNRAVRLSDASDLAMIASQVSAYIGDFPRARDLLVKHEGSAGILGRTYPAVSQFVSGAEAHRRARIDESIAAISDAYRYSPQPEFAYYLAQIQMSAAKWKDAKDTLQRLLDSRGSFIMGDSPALLVPFSERDLSICEKHLGELTEAAEHLLIVKHMWTQADPPLLHSLEQATFN